MNEDERERHQSKGVYVIKNIQSEYLGETIYWDGKLRAVIIRQPNKKTSHAYTVGYVYNEIKPLKDEFSYKAGFTLTEADRQLIRSKLGININDTTNDGGLKLTKPKVIELSDTDRLEAKLDKVIELLSSEKELFI